MSIEIIPAIDLIDGKCVRLTQGNYDAKKVYADNPVEVARQFEAQGVRRLHLVDLDGAKSKHVVNLPVIEAIARETNLTIDFGGGIKSDDDIRKVFEAGAQMVTVGSVAVTQPDTFTRWLAEYGADHIILGADVKNERISINGWKEEGDESLLPFLDRYMKYGVCHVLCTDISKDGMLAGPTIDLYKKILAHYPTLNLIASGGVSSMDDIEQLDAIGVRQVVVGKAIYEGRVKLKIGQPRVVRD